MRTHDGPKTRVFPCVYTQYLGLITRMEGTVGEAPSFSDVMISFGTAAHFFFFNYLELV